MTTREAFEILGLPTGSDWGGVQEAYLRKKARAEEARSALLDEAFQTLRREMMLAPGRERPLAPVFGAPRAPRGAPKRALAVAAAAAAAFLSWRALRPTPVVMARAAAAVTARPFPVPAPAPPARAGTLDYTVTFAPGTEVMTPPGEALLGRVADTMHYYPLDDLYLVGYASRDELQAETLARERAMKAYLVLVRTYGMNPEHVHVDSKVVGFEAPKVELYVIEGR